MAQLISVMVQLMSVMTSRGVECSETGLKCKVQLISVMKKHEAIMFISCYGVYIYMCIRTYVRTYYVVYQYVVSCTPQYVRST